MTPMATARLHLRELTPDDAPFLLALLNDPDWIRNIGDRGVRSVDAARDYAVKGPIAMYANRGFGLWMVETRDGTPTGMCGLIKRDTLEDVDIGFAFLPEFRGKGYAFEAATASLAVAAKLGMKRVVGIVSFHNADSIALLVKLGFAFERPIRMPNDSEDIALYAKAIDAKD